MDWENAAARLPFKEKLGEKEREKKKTMLPISLGAIKAGEAFRLR